MAVIAIIAPTAVDQNILSISELSLVSIVRFDKYIHRVVSVFLLWDRNMASANGFGDGDTAISNYSDKDLAILPADVLTQNFVDNYLKSTPHASGESHISKAYKYFHEKYLSGRQSKYQFTLIRPNLITTLVPILPKLQHTTCGPSGVTTITSQWFYQMTHEFLDAPRDVMSI